MSAVSKFDDTLINIPKTPDSNESSEKLSLSAKLKNLAFNWITTSTSHGLPRIFQTDLIYLKILWAIMFIASTGLCSYIVINYLITFFSYEVDTSVSLIYSSPTTFPAVTICNLNPFYKPRANTFITKTLASNNMAYVSTLSSLGANQSAISLARTVLSLLKRTAAVNQSLSTEDRKNLGFYLDDMLLSCTYNGVACSATDFYWFQSYDYGNCYSFNLGTSSNGTTVSYKTTGSSGPSTGLELELFVGDPNQHEDYVYKSGIYVVIHNQTATPLLQNEGFHVAAGYQTNVGITRTFVTKLSSPYSNCITNTTSSSSYSSELYQAIFNTLKQKSYRQVYCFKLCYQKFLINNCSCFDGEYSSPYANVTIKPCMTTSELSCQESFKASFESTSISDQCLSYCPEECSKAIYYTNLNVAHYPTTFYSNWLLLQSNLLQKFPNNQTNASQIQNCILKLNVYYDGLTYTSMDESASLTWDVLLGNIGGTFGLCIGISILSFFECVVLIIEIFRYIHLHKMEKGKVGNHELRKFP